MHYIAFDGCIGAGKTTFAHVIAAKLALPLVVENVDRHPFINEEYEYVGDSALQTELVFILMHYHETLRMERCDARVVSDFVITKAELYSSLTLSGEELALHRHVYQFLRDRLSGPALTVYIEAEDELLLRRIRARGREWETGSDQFITSLNQRYRERYGTRPDSRSIKVRAEEFDVVNDADAEDRLVAVVAAALQEK